jgi:hypothetical protein
MYHQHWLEQIVFKNNNVAFLKQKVLEKVVMCTVYLLMNNKTTSSDVSVQPGGQGMCNNILFGVDKTQVTPIFH